jgi:signal transduction histidine kinase
MAAQVAGPSAPITARASPARAWMTVSCRIIPAGRAMAAATMAQRHFVANASHELRTPLTLDRTLLQLALRNPAATTEQWRATGYELLESGVHQEHLLEALLTLASSETGTTSREPADLSEAAAASLHATRSEAGRQQVHVQTALDSAPMLGDSNLIERLALNLLDNAIRHNTTGGTVQLTTGQQDGQAAIADAHHATIDAHAQPEGGLRVQVSFPGQPPDTTSAEFDHLRSDAGGLRMSTTGQAH